VAIFRALAYAAVFIGLVLILAPAQVLSWSGVTRPATLGLPQYVGVAITILGAGLALACVLVFAVVGRGTPAPFDPPRQLVIAGPYRFVRNPMYLGADLALAGAALLYESVGLAVFLLAFMVVTHAFVVFYEEPTLHRMFGASYGTYCRSVARWVPHRPVRRMME
jgi:protein-S-isoprenylcysteine O-methyltransferase Ste14